MTFIFPCCTVLGHDCDSALFHVLNQRLLEFNVLQSCTAQSIARILNCFSRLRFYDETVVVALGKRLLDIVQSNGSTKINEKTLVLILRSMVRLSRGSSRLGELYFEATRLLLMSEVSTSSVVSSCDDYNLSMIAWCFAKGRYFDGDVLYIISKRMVEYDVISRCSPASASRMFKSVVSLCSLPEGKDSLNTFLKETIQILYERLGDVLLTKDLSGIDESSLMWAMAKSTYALDMGVFDHLSESFTKSNLSKATTKQLAQALWACGKMFAFEDPLRTNHHPPYMNAALEIASNLSMRPNEMSPKDIAQSLWSLAKLKLHAPAIVEPFLLTVKRRHLYNEFTSQEISNIVWALSKMEEEDCEFVKLLANTLLSGKISSQVKAQEAANMLYALAKLRIEDEKLYLDLSDILMKQVDSATSQAIANALWAHEQMDLIPPQKLFNKWAEKRLGIEIGFSNDLL